MLSHTIEKIGSNPVSALISGSEMRLYFPYARMTDYVTPFDEKNREALEEMRIPYVDTRNADSAVMDRVKRTLTFSPMEIAATGLSGTDFRGHIDDWLALAESMGANVSWGAREPAKFTLAAYDPMILSALSSVTSKLDLPQTRTVEWTGKLKSICQTLADKYAAFVDPEGNPQNGVDTAALDVLRGILYREQSLVSAYEKTESDALESFVNQVGFLRVPPYSEDFRRCVVLSMREVRQVLAARSHQNPEMS